VRLAQPPAWGFAPSVEEPLNCSENAVKSMDDYWFVCLNIFTKVACEPLSVLRLVSRVLTMIPATTRASHQLSRTSTVPRFDCSLLLLHLVLQQCFGCKGRSQ
jgi:hypothetical protein